MIKINKKISNKLFLTQFFKNIYLFEIFYNNIHEQYLTRAWHRLDTLVSYKIGLLNNDESRSLLIN